MEQTLLHIRSLYFTNLGDLDYDDAQIIIENMRPEVTYFTIDDRREHYTFYFRNGQHMMVHHEDGPRLAQLLFPSYIPAKYKKPQWQPPYPVSDVHGIDDDETDV